MQKVEEDKQKAAENVRRLKETMTHSKQVYEKEIRRARKEAFKASSDSIRLHEELKSSRDSESGLREKLESTKQTVATVEKDAFSARYKLIEIDEELQRMKEKLKVAEEERDALKTSLKEEEVARIAAEGRIPLPTPATPDEFCSPKKKRVTPTSTPQRQSRKIDNDLTISSVKLAEDKIENLEKRLEVEKQLKRSAEDLVDFMKLECQLKRCCCRRAEAENAKDYVFDDQFDAIIAGIYKRIIGINEGTRPTSSQADRGRPRKPKKAEVARPKTPPKHVEEDTTVAIESIVEFSPETGTFRTINSPPKPKLEEPKRATAVNEDLVPEGISVAPPLAPIAPSESPSILSLSENTTSTKSPQDNYQTLPSERREIPQPSTSNPSLPSTPQKSEPTSRPSDADLLSFTPFNPATTFPSHFRQPLAPASTTIQPQQQQQHPPPLTHSQSYILSTTTITTVPLADEPSTPSSKTLLSNPSYTMGYSPGTTKTREEALQSIERWRRGRSRSVVLGGTPKRFGAGSGRGGEGERASAGGTPGKRDCSAPVPRVTRILKDVDRTYY